MINAGHSDVLFFSNRKLLERVLGNMITNALEASTVGDQVTLEWTSSGDRVEFKVNNPAVIPPGDCSSIFTKSFSTKGTERGFGTYGMRLLSQYLNGEVSFVSEQGQGTTFLATYPISSLPAFKETNDESLVGRSASGGSSC